MIGEPETYWERMWRLYEEVLERPDDAARREFLDMLHDDDPVIAREVRSLLAVRGRGAKFLVHPPTIVINSDCRAEGGALMNIHAFSDPLVGREVAGRYVIESLIGRGGMGAVYAALQRSPRKRVAMKIMRGGVLNERALSRIQLEAEALARLHHVGIAQVFDSGTFDLGEGVHAYIAMELIDGPTLNEYIEGRKVALVDRVRLLVQVCDAVAHAHQRGVIHCDLKPTNILVDLGSGTASVQLKVVDFGVSQVVGADITETLTKNLQDMAGTLAYMAPERLKDPANAPATVATDVYALGVIGYQLLTGRLPIEVDATSVLLAIQAHVNATPRRLGSHGPQLRGDLETIVHKAMDRDPDRRYRSAADLGEELRRWLRHEPIVARPPTVAYQMLRFAQRHKALVIGTALAVATLIIGSGVAIWQAVRAHQAERLATMRFNDVRGLSHTVIFDLESAIRNLPGSTPARRLLVQNALAYLEGLRAQAGDAEDLLHEIAMGYERVGDVLGNALQANLGDFKGAAAAYQRAIVILRQLVAHRPADPSLRHDLARTLTQRGVVDQSPPTLANGMRTEFAEAHDLYQALLLKHPTPEVLTDFAMLQTHCALHQWDATQSATAINLLHNTVNSLRALHAKHPADQRIEHQLAFSAFYLGVTLQAANDHVAAETAITESSAHFHRMIERDPLDAAAAEWTAYATITKAVSRAAVGDYLAAQRDCEEAIKNLERLSKADPQNQRAFRCVGIAYARAGAIWESSADKTASTMSDQLAAWHEALNWYRRSLEHEQERQRRGWSGAVESNYIDQAQANVDRCVFAIRQLETAK